MIDSSNIGGLQRARVVDNDGGKIGSVGQVFLDSRNGQPAWVTVHTGLFGTSESFVPLTDARFDGEDVVVPFDKSMVKDAPRIDADGMLTPDQERALYRYYGADYGDEADADADAADADARVDADAQARAKRDAAERQREEREARVDREAAAREHEDEDEDGVDEEPVEYEPRHAGTHGSDGSRMRLRKYVVTEQQTFTVPVRHEELRLEPDTDDDRPDEDRPDEDRPDAGRAHDGRPDDGRDDHDDGRSGEPLPRI